MYPADMLRKRGLDWFVNLNPFAVMLDLLRDPILYGRFPSATSYGLGVAAVGLTAAIAAFWLSRVEKRMIFYL
jgi:lipopolysaccharide transport system permease protein